MSNHSNSGKIIKIQDHDIDIIVTIAISLEESGDISSAISLYKFGIQFSDLTAMTRLADILSENMDFLDIPSAEKLYKQACVAGHAPGCRNLAILYMQLGKSVLHDRYMSYAKTRGDVWQEID